MVKFQWPIKREKHNAKGLEDGISSQQLRAEAGLKGIDREEDLSCRIKGEDECNTRIINHMLDQLIILLEKTEKTVQDMELIRIYNAWLVNWEQYRATRKVAVAWSVAGEDHDMSKRYRAYETYFSRNWQSEWETKKIMRFSAYMRSICYKDKHVEPYDRVIIQSLPSSQRIYLGEKDHNE